MSKEIWNTLLDQFMKEQILLLETRGTSEVSLLTALDADMKKINKCVYDCNTMTDTILMKIRDKEEEERKKKELKEQKSQRMSTEPAKGKGNSNGVGKKAITRNKTQTNLKTPLSKTVKAPATEKKVLPKSKSESAFDRTKSADKPAKKPDWNTKKSLPKTPTSSNTKTSTNSSKQIVKPIKGKTPAVKSNTDKTKDKNTEKTKEVIKTKEVKPAPEESKPVDKENVNSEDLSKIEDSATKVENEPKPEEPQEVPVQTNDEVPVKEEPVKTEPPKEEPPKAEEKPKQDYSPIIADKWPHFKLFFSTKEIQTFLLLSKKINKAIWTDLISTQQKTISEAEGKWNDVKLKYKEEELTKEIGAFTLARGAMKAVNWWNDDMYFKVFLNEALPSEEILLVYRIYFQWVNKEHDIINSSDNKEFWGKACEYCKANAEGKLGSMIEAQFKSLDFSNENIRKVMILAKEHTHQLTPIFYSKLCPTTGLFIFLVKEALEYTGVLQDKKTLPSRIYQNASYWVEYEKKKIELLNKLLNLC